MHRLRLNTQPVQLRRCDLVVDLPGQAAGPFSVGEVVQRTGLSQPNASMHLGCLAECGFVTWERLGKFVHYEIADKRVVKLLDQAAELLIQVGPLIDACPRYRRPIRAQDAGRRRR